MSGRRSPADWMQEAIALAADNARSGRGGPFAALVVRGDELIASGGNQVTSSLDPTAHAEVVAIRAACARLQHFQLTGCEVYASSEPCPMCLGAVYWARAEKLYFAATRHDAARAGFDDSVIYSELGKSLAERAIPTEQILTAGAGEPFEVWLLKPDKIPY